MTTEADIRALQRELERLQAQIVRPWDLVSPFLALPGLVGYWPLSSVARSSGNAYDLSGQGRTLSYNGNPMYSATSLGVAYLDLDGTGDYLSRTDETDLDILGTESIYAAEVRGLSLGGWFWADTLATTQLAGKYNATGNQRSYRIEINASGNAIIRLSDDGTATTATTSSNAIATGGWFFVAGVFDPSTALDVFLNGTWTRNDTSIPASVYSGTSGYTIGAAGDATNLLDGRAACVFLCAQYLSDAAISGLYQQTRGAFGV